MFDLSWSELLVIVVIAVFVIGPKDIPKIMYQLGRLMRRLQYMRFAMSQQFDEILKAGDIDELRKGVNFEARKYDEASADDEELVSRHPGEGRDLPESRERDSGLRRNDGGEG
jgi:sec-independent protein translocase protein TatB